VDCNSTGIVVLRIHPGWEKVNKPVNSSFGASQIKVEKNVTVIFACPFVSLRT